MSLSPSTVEIVKATAPAVTANAEKMAATHVARHVKPEHYPMVGLSILGAIKDVLGDAATADILTAREQELYAQASSTVNA